MKDKVRTAYEALAAGYSQKIDTKPHNAYYDRPNTLGLLPDVNGLEILDAACGPGKYAEILLQQGAVVHGVDFSPRMVDAAKARNADAGQFEVHDLTEPMPQFTDGAFDIVLCALALDYLEDWSTTLKEFHRVLKPGGIVVVSMEHPFFSYTYFKSRNYFSQETVSAVWKGFGHAVEVFTNRRSLQDMLQPFLEQGFLLERLLEPQPVKEFEQHDPKHYRELMVFPAFICMRFRKPE